MKRSLLKTSLSLATVSVLAGSLVATSLPAAHAAPKEPTFITKEGLEAVTRLLQEAGPEAATRAAAPGEAFVADDIDTASAEDINVIVQFSGQPAAVGQYAAKLGYGALAKKATVATVQTEQDAFVRSAQAKSVPFKVDRRFNTVLNGMEITVRADRIPQLAKLPGVKSIHKNVLYYPADVTDSYQAAAAGSSTIDTVPLEQIGVLKAWERGYTGKGLKVGVIDTGIDYKHPDLVGNYVEGGGYDAVNQDDDPYEDLPDGDYEGSYHGTHVSGTIAGTASNATANHVQKGVAYDAKLYAYKVLGPDGGTSAQVIDGIEHAVEDKMDVINLSLGSDLEKDPDSPDSAAVNNAVLAGVVAVVANGNAGAGNQYYYSMGSPASSQLAISVGATTSDSIRVAGGVRSEVGSLANEAQTDLMSWTTDEEDFNAMFGAGPIQGVYVGLGSNDDYEGLDKAFLADKIVFISRGNLTFDEKAKIAAKHGAKAAVIFNGNAVDPNVNVPDLSDDIKDRNGPIGPIGFLGDSYDYIPTFDMAGKTGRALARALQADPTQTLKFTMKNDFAKTTVAGERMADFSSRGPNSDGNYGIKPDLSAPGVQIFSSVPAYGAANPDASYDKAYAKLSGTSMATPHVAGLALLIKQAHPRWTPTDIRAALANTSEKLVDEEATPYDVYSQGAGQVDVMNAIDTRAIIESLDEITIYDDKMNPTTIPSEASSVSFGKIKPGDAAVKKPLRVKNLSNASVTYNAKVVMHPSVTSDAHHPIPTPDVRAIVAKLDGLTGNQITVGPASAFEFNLSAAAIGQAQTGVYEGEVLLESAGLPSLHLPFVIHVGAASDDNDFPIQNLTLSSPTVSKDAPIDITASLPKGKINHLYAAVYDMNDQPMGLVAEYYDTDEDKDVLNPLPSTFTIPEFDGSYNMGIYVNDGNKANAYLPEGRYKLAVVGSVYNADYELVDQSVAYKTFYMSGEAGEPTPPTDPPTSPPIYGTNPVTPSEAAYNKEVAASVIAKGQTGIAITPQSSVEGTQLAVSVTDADLQKAITGAKSPVALTIGAASDNAVSAQLKLTAAQVKTLKEAGLEGVIVFSWNDASIALPLSALAQAAEGADVAISIKQDEASKAEFAKQAADAVILGTPYVFEASSVSGGVTAPLKLKADEVAVRSFLIEKGTDASAAGALYLDGGKLYPVPARIAQASDGASIVTIERPGFSTYAAASRHVAFADIDKSWAREEIQTLADKFLLNGTSEHAFSPKANVTRAQFASMLVRALGLQAQTTAAPFADVKGGDWFASDVATAYAAGLVTGAEGQFKPNAAITRQDLTVMLARAIKLIDLQPSNTGGPRAYADAATFGGYAAASIQLVTDAGLMKGVELKGVSYFQPAEATTREAAAKVLHDLLQAAKRMN
ncbi:S8 family serine peptidase [Paenibacillus glycinis]|uniref:S8 family serine peptidase n=1 Tax=Paenibacillus glycinis TaxID=2697035 RepID=A0ABW9XNV9_9BACL|nr:S8 family serine peptidase [Paenibacillus glycinis]NBD24330.1 S8 family serine peptidase [Paenibacillus glycinis]